MSRNWTNSSSSRTGALALLAAAAACIPFGSIAEAGTVVADYYFNGPIGYDATTQTLSVSPSAQIFQSVGLPAAYSLVPGVNQAGSQIDLSMQLNPASVLDNGLTTTASFTEPAGYQAALYLGNGSGGTAASPVLTGTLTGLAVVGFDNNNLGILTGYLHPTGGLAIQYFSDPSDVIALDFNLSTTFSQQMYAGSFTGQINGQVEAVPMVPLPAGLPLLLSGLFGLAVFRCGRTVAFAS